MDLDTDKLDRIFVDKCRKQTNSANMIRKYYILKRISIAVQANATSLAMSFFFGGRNGLSPDACCQAFSTNTSSLSCNVSKDAPKTIVSLLTFLTSKNPVIDNE